MLRSFYYTSNSPGLNFGDDKDVEEVLSDRWSHVLSQTSGMSWGVHKEACICLDSYGPRLPHRRRFEFYIYLGYSPTSLLTDSGSKYSFKPRASMLRLENLLIGSAEIGL